MDLKKLSERCGGAAARDLIGTAGNEKYIYNDLNKLIPQLAVDVDKMQIKPADAVALVVEHFPTRIAQFREAISQHIADVKQGRLGKMRPTMLLHTALRELDRQVASSCNIANPSFLESMASQLNRSGFLEEAEHKSGSRLTGYGYIKYYKDDTLRALPVFGKNGKPAALTLSGGDASVSSLKVVYRALQEMQAAGLLKEEIGLNEEEFIKAFHITSEQAVMRGIRSVVSGAVELASQISGRPFTLLKSSDVEIDAGDTPQQQSEKIVRLASALGMQTDGLAGNLQKLSAGESQDAERDVYGLFEHSPYFQDDAAARPSGSGQALVDDMHEKLLQRYRQERENHHKDCIGMDGGIKGTTWVHGSSREDFFYVTIPIASIAPHAVSKLRDPGGAGQAASNCNSR